MFTKIAINYLRNRIVKIDDENEFIRANAFLNLIEQFLTKNNSRIIRIRKIDDNKIIIQWCRRTHGFFFYFF